MLGAASLAVGRRQQPPTTTQTTDADAGCRGPATTNMLHREAYFVERPLKNGAPGCLTRNLKRTNQAAASFRPAVFVVAGLRAGHMALADGVRLWR